MTRTRRLPLACLLTSAVLAGLLAMPAAPALAQAQNGNFLNNLFTRGESPRGQGAPQTQQTAQAEDNEVILRIDRMENALRQLTGTIEQLQYRNQQLEMQLKRMQDDTEYRLQQLGSRAPAAPTAPAAPAIATPPAAGAMPGRRGDAFDPAQHPNAAGAPRALGNQASIAAPEPIAPVGAPGGRNAGAPLDLNSLAGNGTMRASATAAPAGAVPQQPAQLPGPPPRNVSSTGTQLATLPPSARPQDEYDMAYGYVLHKDYALAEQTFRDFLRKYPQERLVPDAQYWLGESLFQQQRYRDAAESFLAVSTKYERAGKAPDALLRLGQSLAALSKKEAACATLAEVGRKYPKASAGVKRAVAQEQKRVRC